MKKIIIIAMMLNCLVLSGLFATPYNSDYEIDYFEITVGEVTASDDFSNFSHFENDDWHVEPGNIIFDDVSGGILL